MNQTLFIEPGRADYTRSQTVLKALVVVDVVEISSSSGCSRN